MKLHAVRQNAADSLSYTSNDDPPVALAKDDVRKSDSHFVDDFAHLSYGIAADGVHVIFFPN